MPDRYEELAARVVELEKLMAAPAAFAAGQTPVRMEENLHHPRPGTWVGDSREAECRYCGQGIYRDDRGQWFYQRDLVCYARAAGAEARD
jgi:hypothetical protein